MTTLPPGRSRPRTVLALVVAMAVAAMTALLAPAGPARAVSMPTITVDPTAASGTVSPSLFGANTRFGFDQFGGSDPSTGQVYPALSSLAQDAGISMLRYPGGIIGSLFHWKDAIGPIGSRGCQTHGGSGMVLDSHYGVDEAARFAESIGATTSIVVNFGDGTAQEAADWVAYMNAPSDGSNYWGSLRKANGHAAPYHVKYWEVGNELNGYANGDYWLSGAGGGNDKYATGGTVSFTKQPMGGKCDRTTAGSLSTGAANQSFYAYYPAVAAGQTVYVGGTAWTQVSGLSSAGATDTVYTIDPATGKVTFGDGVHGAVPPSGKAITLTYTSGPHDGYTAFRDAMRAVDPTIKVCSDFVLPTVTTDCVQDHPYVQFDDTANASQAHDIAMSQSDTQNSVATLQNTIAGYPGNPTVMLSEYGMYLGGYTGDDGNYLASLDQGLVEANDMANWIRLGIPVAERHCLVDYQFTAGPPGVGGLGGAAQSLFGGGSPDFVNSASAHVLTLFTHMTGSTVVSSSIAGNPVKAGYTGNYGSLKTIATKDGSGHLFLTVINRDTVDRQAQVTPHHFASTGPAAVWTVDGASTTSVNTPTDPDAVTLTKSTTPVDPGGFAYTFPAHSVTAFQLTGAETHRLDRTGWSVKYVDSTETVAANGAGSNVLDGDLNTRWITKWSGGADPLPHEIQLDLGTSHTLTSLSYLPRQDGNSNGMIANYEVYVSTDGVNWGSPVATGTWGNSAAEKTASFPPTTGRYVRLRALSEVLGQQFTTADEINLGGT